MKKKLINIFRLVIVGIILLVFISPTGMSRIDLYTDSADYTDGGSFNISSDAYIDIWSVDGVNITGDTTITGDSIIDGSLTLDSFLDMDFNDINNVNDLHVDNDVDVGNDLHVNDKIEHLGDSDTYLDFNGNQILFFAGGNQILNMQTALATFGVNVSIDENLTVSNNAIIDGDVGIGVTPSTYSLDIIDLPASVLQVRIGSSLTDNIPKVGGFAVPHFSLEEEDLVALYALTTSDSSAVLGWGGGSALHNAVTQQVFYTGDGTTLTGTGRYVIDSSGDHNFVSGNITTTGLVKIDSDTNGLQLGDSQDVTLYSDGAGLFNFKAEVADTDLTLNFEGTTNSGVFSWLEDEDEFNAPDDFNVSDGNVFVWGNDPTATYPYTLNLHNPGRAWNYIFIGNDEGGPDQGAFFGLEGAPGNDRFSLYNWQGGDIEFFTDPNPTAGSTRLEIKNTGDVLVYENLTVGLTATTPGGLNLRGKNVIGTVNDRGGFIQWYHDSDSDGYTFVNTDSLLVFNNTAQNKDDDVGKAWIELDTGNASFDGDITSANVFIPQYIFSHTNETIPISGQNIWTNVTFSQEDSDLKQGISHTYNDNTNHTFTISMSGIYNIDYDFDVEDTSGASTDIDVAGRMVFFNGTEIIGSVFETDITKKGTEVEISHNFLARLNAGDQVIFQFVGTDADIQISTHGTFGEHPESATIIIDKIANI